MKNIISFIVLLLLVTACKKKPGTEYDLRKGDNSGTITAMLNGKPWKGDIVLTSSSDNNLGRIYILGDVYVNGMNKAGLEISNIDLHNDTQRVYNFIKWTVFDQTGYRRGWDTCIASYSTGAYDVVENVYGVIESEDNFVKLNGYNATSPSVKGSFQLSFYRIKAITKPQAQGLPDTLRFTDGQIDVQMRIYQ